LTLISGLNEVNDRLHVLVRRGRLFRQAADIGGAQHYALGLQLGQERAPVELLLGLPTAQTPARPVVG
jgi:hypothetical protein